MFRMGLLAAAVSACALAPSLALAETRAVVVGVSGYPNLPENLRLNGPKNDAREIATTIVSLGIDPANVTVLADGVGALPQGVTAPGPGTKAAILAALDKLAEDSQPGDLAFFYFSGHGSQQLDQDGDEHGGADEVFLPYDVGHWSGAGIENALVDDELNARIEKILDKGVDFFGMVDACHSATGFRAVPGDDVRNRGVDPAELGVPQSANEEARGSHAFSTAAADAKPGRGRAAFFYAAQENEEAADQVPPGADESFGLFTYSLLKRLNQKPAQTYRDLHQAVMADIKRNTLLATQTPELEGDLLDQPVLRLSNAVPQRLWNKNYGDKLEAGQLAGLQAGTVMALYNDPSDPDDAAVAYATIVSAGATKSVLAPAAKPCAGGSDCSTALADETLFKKARFARVAQPAANFALSLSEPLLIDPDDAHDYTTAIAALRAAVGSKDLSARVSFRSTGYDIAIGLADGKLVFAPAAGLIDANGKGSSPRLTLPDDPGLAEEEARAALDRIAKAMALQRLAADLGKADALGLKAEVLVEKYMGAAILGEKCPEGEELYTEPTPADDAPVFAECDTLSFKMSNSGRKPLDVTVLLIGTDFSISTVWPQDGLDNRVPIGDSRTTVPLLRMQSNPATASEERLVFIAVPGTNKSHVAFDSLDQEGLRGAADESREVAAARDLLAAALGDMQRATAPTGLDEEMAIDVKPFVAAKRGG
jgi:metacaspase-1